MTDLDATRLCAEAMGRKLTSGEIDGMPEAWIADTTDTETYNPLKDDAQAMALVKKMQLNVCATLDMRSRIVRTAPADGWSVEYSPMGCVDRTHDKNLNRAIVYCVARMQQKVKP